ncbi:MAK10-like protein [Tanacetum coccineum]
MGDENHIRTIRDYSKPSHEGYRNTIELSIGNNVVPLRSDIIRLVQNGCLFYELWSEDPNQHLKDFLKLVDSLNHDGANRERTRLRLFQFSLRDQASNWLERLPARSITTWEDLTTHFLTQFFPPGRTAKLRNDILIRSIDQSADDKLRDRNDKESWALLEDLSLYDNESWNNPRDFAKPVKAIGLPQDVPITSDRRLIELENQVQCLMEAHLAPTQPDQVNKVTTSCEICSGPHDTQNCMEDPEQAFVEYASLRTNEAGDLGFYMWYQSLVALDLGLISDKPCVAKAYGRKEMLVCDRFCDDFVTLLRRHLDVSAVLVYLLYGFAGLRVITAAGGRSVNDGCVCVYMVGSASHMIYRNCILPIFLAGLSLSTCQHIHLFWSHSVIPTGYLVLAGFIMFLSSFTTGYIIPADRLYGSYWSAYGFFCLPCSILFVIAASIIVSKFMVSQDARLSKFEADFKQQQSEMTNKIDTVLKAIIDRIAGALLKDTVKKSKTEYFPIFEVLARAPIYNAILDKYVESLELGKNGSIFVQGEVPTKMEDPGLFTLPCRLGDSKPFDALADLGSCVNIIPLYLFKKFNIGLLEETGHIFRLANGTKAYPVRIVKDVEVHIGKLKLLNDFYVIDMKKDLETPLLVGRGFLATANAVIDCKMAKIAVGEGITRSVLMCSCRRTSTREVLQLPR